MANFIPPLDLGQFTPSASAIASWLYQIWKYLQENPIQSNETIQAEISDTVAEAVPGAVAEYIEENPVDVPVLSVNGMIGAVVIAYNNLVTDGSTLPIYRAATGETSNNDLLEAWAEGCRFLLVDDTTPYMMVKNVNQGAETINLVPLSGGGGGGGGDVSSVNGRTGAVVLTYNDFVGVSSTIPVLLAANDEISNNDLITAWNQGYRFAVVDGTDPYIIMRSGNTASLLPIGTPVTSVNGKSGAVTLTYPDVNPPTSSVPLLVAAAVPSAADLLTAYNAGNRFLLVGSDLYALTISGQTVTAVQISGGSSAGGSLTLIWSQSITIPTFAPQSITMADSAANYDFLLIKYRGFDSTSDFSGTAIAWNNYSSALTTQTSGNLAGSRDYTINGAVIQFQKAAFNKVDNNAVLVPYAIYGVKL